MVNEWFISLSPFAKYKEEIRLHKTIFSTGEYNGYVVVDKKHPYFGMDGSVLNIDVHGGITWSRSGSDSNFPELKEEYHNDDHWVFGFDTGHSGDSMTNWTKERTEKEAGEMCSQFYMAYIKKLRDDNRNKCGTDLPGGDG